MKHTIVYFLYVAFFLSLFGITSTYAVEPLKTFCAVAPECVIKLYPEEGFCAGTLVRVLNGYKSIETIVEHDVVLDHNLQPKRVLTIATRIAHRYIELIVEDQCIRTGFNQFLQLPYNLQWCTAEGLRACDYVLDRNQRMQHIDQYKPIDHVITLYQLAVEDHIFCIGPSDIIVHNVDIAFGCALLFLEYVAYAHPVFAVIGPTFALATIAGKAYETYWQDSHCTNNDANEIPQSVFLAERYYYEQRKQELVKLRDEFTALYRGILTLKDLFDPRMQINTFSSQFLPELLKYHTQSSWLTISISNEFALSDERTVALRKAREQELALVEKEIKEIHALLVVHFNELIRQAHDAYEAYTQYTAVVKDGIKVWNNNQGQLTDHIASESYEKEIMQECFIRYLQQKIAELKIVIAYYQRSASNTALQGSTNITELFDPTNQFIKQAEQWAQQELTCVRSNMNISESYFARRRIPVAVFKNQIHNAFNKNRTNKDHKALEKAKDTQESISTTGGPNDPKKPKNDDQEDFFKKLKSRSDKKARTNRFGNMYRDPSTKLWWSKDLDGHGGSCYKAFKETARGFQWVFDATNEGAPIIAKHKGPTGLFIPYKEVIF